MRRPEASASALLLDLGGVVLLNAAELVAHLADREPLVRAEVDRLGGVAGPGDELWQRMLRREVTEREYWAERAATLGRALGEDWDTRALIGRLYEAPRDVWLRADAVALMAAAREAGLRVGALTNDLADFHGREWVDEQDFLDGFDVVVDGSVTGVLKPDPRAFGHAVEALGVPAGETVFLDDMPWNVEGARAAGLQAVRVEYADPGAAFDQARRLLGLRARAA